MTDPAPILKRIGYSDKEVAVYLALLELGSSPVRRLADETNINRGTTYDILKSLREQGVVSYFHKKTHTYFVAESPDRLIDVIHQKKEALAQSSKELELILPDLKSRANQADAKPSMKFYEGGKQIATILKDVLATVAKTKSKEYYVYSAADIRRHLYTDFPSFTKKRLAAGIHVKVIALGGGGTLSGNDERKWLTKEKGAPTYDIIYGNKVVMISVNADRIPTGVLITDPSIAETQKMIFDALWKTL